jgi:hypothetical protein
MKIHKSEYCNQIFPDELSLNNTFNLFRSIINTRINQQQI